MRFSDMRQNKIDQDLNLKIVEDFDESFNIAKLNIQESENLTNRDDETIISVADNVHERVKSILSSVHLNETDRLSQDEYNEKLFSQVNQAQI